MDRIDLTIIKPGKGSPGNLYDRQGNLLIPKGQVITNKDLTRAVERGAGQLFTNDTTAFAKAIGIFSLDDPEANPKSGMHINTPIPAGASEAAQRMADAISPASELHTDSTRRLDENLSHGFGKKPKRPTKPARRLGLACLRAEVEHAHQQFNRTVSEMSMVMSEVERGKDPNMSMPKDVLNQFAGSMNRDPSLGPLATQMANTDQGYLTYHGLNTALLLMTVAIRQGYGMDEVVNSGVGAMFQDIGMMRIPQDMRSSPNELTDAERHNVEQHPVYSVDILDSTGLANPLMLTMCYESHERCDGSGFPRRKTKPKIHPLSRILSAVDVYTAITSRSLHQREITPYEGMVALLKEVQAGRLDGEAVRAVLDNLSLFPIGSYVELSDGQFARVIRANGPMHTKPVVVGVSERGKEDDFELDLSREMDLKVVRGLLKDEAMAPRQPVVEPFI